MCHKIKNITKVKNGQLTKCETCNVYHLVFNNILLEFCPIEFESFKRYVLEIEIAFWEKKDIHIDLKRKIPIPTLQENLVIMFDRQEVEELKTLLFSKNTHRYKIIKYDIIDYCSILN